MKKNILTKLLALMMAFVLLLGITCEALAEVSFSQYMAVIQKKAAELYTALLKTADTDSFIDLVRAMSDDNILAIYEILGQDQGMELENYFEAMAVAEYEERNKELEIFEYTPVFPAKNYAQVAPLRPPVVGEAPAVRMLAASLTAEGDVTTGTDSSAKGIELEKEIVPKDGGYEIILKAFATGTTVTTETSEAVPTDIILVLDQSGSMSNNMTTPASVSYNLYGNVTNATLWQNQSNIFVKVGDEYKRVTVNRQETGSIDTYTPVNYQSSTYDHNYTNSELWQDQANLYQKNSSGEYRSVTVTRDQSWFLAPYTYTYSLPYTNDTINSENEYGRPDFRNKEVYLKSTVITYSYTYTYEDENGNTVTVGTSEGDDNTTFADGTTLMGSKLYQQQTIQAGTISRMEALKSAVNSFLNSVNARAVADNVNHRVAIVGFASTGNSYNNTEILSTSDVVNYGSATNANYQDALVSASVNGVVNTRLTTAVTRLATGGDTYSEYGIDMANKIFAQHPIQSGEKRNRVVIMFTDGYTAPSGTNNIDYGMSDRAISNANTTKNTYGATVYTVGIFDNANPAADITSNFNYGSTNAAQQLVAANRYMHYVSSNYPSATSLQNGGNRANTTGSYYLSANDGGTLSNIFQTIAGQIESGSSSTTLDEEAVLKDIIATSFDLSLPKLESGDYNPEGITVQVADCTGKSADGVYSFGTPTAATGITVTAGSDKAIDITGFDYAENWCGVVNGTARGKQLIITIPIKVREGFLGGNNVPTNGENSGIYENKDATEALKKFDAKDTDVEIQPITVTAEEKNVYIMGSLTAEQLASGSTMKSGNVVINTDPTVKNYGLEDWQNAYVNITLPAYSGAAMSNLQNDTTYTLTGSIAPIDTSGTAQAKSATSEAAKVNVFKPELTFKDGTVDYNTEFPADDTLTAGDNGGYAKVAWKHDGTTLSTNVTMTGAAPTLTKEYTPISGVNASNIVTSTEEVPVKVAVKVGSTDTDITESCTFIREKCVIEGEKTGKPCAWDETQETENTDAQPAFVLHVVKVSGDLKIIKKIVDANGNELTTDADKAVEFTVEVTLKDTADANVTKEYTLSNGSKVTFTNGVATLKVTAGTPVVIEEIEYGYGYSVAEKPEVVEGYRLKEYDAKVSGTMTADGAETTITNYKTTSLSLTKKVTGAGSSRNDVFDFAVTLLDKNDTTSKYRYTVSTVGTEATEGELTNTNIVQLKHGQTAVIKDVPIGAEFTIVETVPDDYTTANATQNGTVNADANQNKVAYLNEHKHGTLTINKTFNNNTTTDTAVFIIKQNGNEYQRVSITGTGTVNVALPYGNYTIAEDDWSWNYDTTVSGDQSFEFNKNNLTHEVSYTNTSDDKWLNEEIKKRNEFN